MIFAGKIVAGVNRLTTGEFHRTAGQMATGFAVQLVGNTDFEHYLVHNDYSIDADILERIHFA